MLGTISYFTKFKIHLSYLDEILQMPIFYENSNIKKYC